MSIWYENATDDIVVSTRVRLARNFAGIPFRPNAEQQAELSKRVRGALDRGSLAYTAYDMAKLDPAERQSLLEKHLISAQMADGRGEALISADETVSVLIGEEDHIRIQCILPNLDLDAAWQTADRLDDLIEEQEDYAFSEEFGYLTHCPTNVGTGMRASVMLHLPALTMTGQIRAVSDAVAKLGIAVRGFYGEGTEAQGCFYQFSNQVTLGLSEREILDKLREVAGQVVETERTLRTQAYKQYGKRLEDKVCRAYGVLRYARVLTSSELKSLLSDVRLGVALGILQGPSMQALTRLMIEAEPANILVCHGKELDAAQRDEQRAQMAGAVMAG